VSEAIEGWLAVDVSVFRQPFHIDSTTRITLDGVVLTCLGVDPFSRDNLFSVRFEEAAAMLAGYPGADVEADGFFVRTGHDRGRRWQLQGHLYELCDRLWRLDLRGECPSRSLDEALAVVGWPQTPIVVQLVPQGVTVDEIDFRRWAKTISENATKLRV
jgi:hypothetical protein